MKDINATYTKKLGFVKTKGTNLFTTECKNEK